MCLQMHFEGTRRWVSPCILWYVAYISLQALSCQLQLIMRIVRLESDDVIIPLFAVIAVAVACQGETFL